MLGVWLFVMTRQHLCKTPEEPQEVCTHAGILKASISGEPHRLEKQLVLRYAVGTASECSQVVEDQQRQSARTTNDSSTLLAAPCCSFGWDKHAGRRPQAHVHSGASQCESITFANVLMILQVAASDGSLGLCQIVQKSGHGSAV